MLIIAISASTLSGCGYFESNNTLDVLKRPDDTPYTKELIKSLPEGLRGDTENARYTGERLRNNDEE